MRAPPSSMAVFLAVFLRFKRNLGTHAALSREDFCCSEHTMQLEDSATTTSHPVQDKKDCLDLCLDNPRCLVSMHSAGEGTCKIHSQTSRQIESNDASYATFLCRTRAMQVCSRQPYKQIFGMFLGDNFTYFGSDGSLSQGLAVTGDQCVPSCREAFPTRVVAALINMENPNECWCYLDHVPTLVDSSRYEAILCANRFISCRAKNSPDSTACVRHPTLRLYPAYDEPIKPGPLYPNYTQILTPVDEDTCEEECSVDPRCVGANYHAANKTCGLIPDPDSCVPGQIWGQQEFTAIICR